MGWDINDLLIFTKVVECGSFTQAARDLGLPKSTVSRRVARLEDHLRAPLLQRTTRKLHLTEAGSLLLDHGQTIAEQWEAAESAVAQMSSEPAGLVRFTAPTEMAPIVAPLVAQFQQAYPRVCLEVSLTNRYVNLTGEGFDVALRAARQLEEVGLMARRLGASRLTMVASPGYLEKYGRPTKPSDLSQHRAVLHPRFQKQTTWRFYHADKEVEVGLPCVAGFDHLGGVKHAVIHGLGIGRIPHFYCRQEIERGELEEVLPGSRWDDNSLWVVYPASRHVAPKVRAWVDYLFAHFEWL